MKVNLERCLAYKHRVNISQHCNSKTFCIKREEAGNKNVYFLKKFIYFYLFLAALGLCCCTRAFSSCGEWGLLFDMVCRLLIVVASLAAEHGL